MYRMLLDVEQLIGIDLELCSSVIFQHIFHNDYSWIHTSKPEYLG